LKQQYAVINRTGGPSRPAWARGLKLAHL